MPQNVASDQSLRYLPYTQQYFKTHHQVVEWTVSNFCTSMVPILRKNTVHTFNIKMLVQQSTSVMHVNKLKIQVDKLLKKKKKKKKRPMGHNWLTCIFANAMQQSSSFATATGTQIWPYHKMIKGHPSLIILINLVDLESPMLYTKIQPQCFLSTKEEDF